MEWGIPCIGPRMLGAGPGIPETKPYTLFGLDRGQTPSKSVANLSRSYKNTYQMPTPAEGCAIILRRHASERPSRQPHFRRMAGGATGCLRSLIKIEDRTTHYTPSGALVKIEAWTSSPARAAPNPIAGLQSEGRPPPGKKSVRPDENPYASPTPRTPQIRRPTRSVTR